jgi:hypothetical protein
MQRDDGSRHHCADQGSIVGSTEDASEPSKLEHDKIEYSVQSEFHLQDTSLR